MPLSYTLDKPVLLHYNNYNFDFLNCERALVCSYLVAHGFPFQWFLSDSWGFFYRSHTDFSINKAGEAPAWMNSLQRVYGIDITILQGDDLRTTAETAIKEDEVLFIFVDGWHVPWYYAFQSKHEMHALAVVDLDKENDRLRMTDFWPTVFTDWMDAGVIDTAFQAGDKLMVRLTRPAFRYSEEMFESQMINCHALMVGGEAEGEWAGLVGLQKFRDDLVAMGDEAKEHIADWWEFLKPINDVRSGFYEFLYYLQQHEPTLYEQRIDPELLTAVNETVIAWYALRNGMLKAKMTDTYSQKRILAALDKVILLETKCAELLAKTL